MKNLNQIIQNIKIQKQVNHFDFNVNKLSFDSRNIQENDVFFAIKGNESNGHDFIEKAINLGAKAIICNDIPQNINSEICYIQVEDSSKSLGLIARNFYDNPTEKFKLIGITGTNGKTSCTTLLFDLFRNLGFSCGLVSTVENRINSQIIPSTHTTPDVISLNELFIKMIDSSCDYVFMEVSSHGIHQNRLEGLSFDIAGFTNITHDHLDYHKTFLEYLNTKKRFFDFLPKSAIAISNLDDKNGEVILQNTKAKKKFFSLKKLTDYKAKIQENRLDGMFLNFNSTEFWATLTGEFNAYNLLLVYAISCELGLNSIDVITQISKLKTVKGRFETFISNQNITFIVDYAHTADALKNVLETINKIRTNNETLFTIFGCGGNRDQEKRPEMGKIATRLSNRVIITSDNPRKENPDEIINQIKQGIEPQNFAKYTVISDRFEAIKNAIISAKTNDIILVAGKGHENYQEINGTKNHFDDLETIKNLCNLLNK